MLNEQNYERESWLDQIAENSARQAFSWESYESTGLGVCEFEDAIDFGLTFIEKPFISYGYNVENADELDELPRSTGGVYKWKQDGRGFYIGAHVFVVVDLFSDSVAPTPMFAEVPVVTHHFTFTAVAIKDIGADAFRD